MDKKKEVIKLLQSLKSQGLTQKQIRKATGIPERSQRRYINQPNEVKNPSKKTGNRAGIEFSKISKDTLREYIIKTFPISSSKTINKLNKKSVNVNVDDFISVNFNDIEKFLNSHELRFVWFELGSNFDIQRKSKIENTFLAFKTTTDSKFAYKQLLIDEFDRLLEMLRKKDYPVKNFKLLYLKVILTDFTPVPEND